MQNQILPSVQGNRFGSLKRTAPLSTHQRNVLRAVRLYSRYNRRPSHRLQPIYLLPALRAAIGAQLFPPPNTMARMTNQPPRHRPLSVLVACVAAYIATDAVIIAAAMVLPPIRAFLRGTD
jgi:hypothetical protein